MFTFDQSGSSLTSAVMEIVTEAVRQRSIKQIVVASNTGNTAFKLLDALADAKITDVRVVVVTHVQGFVTVGENEMSEHVRQQLQERGCIVVTAAHALSGGERAFSNRFEGIGPLEIVAHTLRLFCQGVKVALEIGMMAMDAGALNHDGPVLGIGGTGRGADTAVLMSPSTSSHILDSRFHEILCKPE